MKCNESVSKSPTFEVILFDREVGNTGQNV